MDKIPGATTSSELTNELVLSWYNSLLDTSPEELKTRLSEVVKKVVHIPDPSDKPER